MKPKFCSSARRSAAERSMPQFNHGTPCAAGERLCATTRRGLIRAARDPEAPATKSPRDSAICTPLPRVLALAVSAALLLALGATSAQARVAYATDSNNRLVSFDTAAPARC